MSQRPDPLRHIPNHQSIATKIPSINSFLYDGALSDCVLKINNSKTSDFHLEFLATYFIYFENIRKLIEGRKNEHPNNQEKKTVEKPLYQLEVPICEFVRDRTHLFNNIYYYDRNKIQRGNVTNKKQRVIYENEEINRKKMKGESRRNDNHHGFSDLLLETLKKFVYFGFNTKMEWFIPVEIFIPFCHLLCVIGYKGFDSTAIHLSILKEKKEEKTKSQKSNIKPMDFSDEKCKGVTNNQKNTNNDQSTTNNKAKSTLVFTMEESYACLEPFWTMSYNNPILKLQSKPVNFFEFLWTYCDAKLVLHYSPYYESHHNGDYTNASYSIRFEKRDKHQWLCFGPTYDTEDINRINEVVLIMTGVDELCFSDASVDFTHDFIQKLIIEDQVFNPLKNLKRYGDDYDLAPVLIPMILKRYLNNVMYADSYPVKTDNILV